MAGEKFTKKLQILNKTRIGIENWLDQWGAVTYSESGISPIKLSVDFLVVNPIPFAVQVVLPEDLPERIEDRIVRFLPIRISLAERFGPHFPLIVVVPEASSVVPLPELPFVDGVLSADQLPDIQSLPQRIKLRRSNLELLQAGASKNISLMFAETYEKLWTSVVSLEEVGKSSGFPEGTLAEALRLACQSHTLKGKNLQSAVAMELHGLVKDLITRKVGGRFDDLQITDKTLSTVKIQGLTWVAPNGRSFFLRFLNIDFPEVAVADGDSGNQEDMDVGDSLPEPNAKRTYQERQAQTPYQSLMAEAWIVRARGSLQLNELVVVLGAARTLPIKSLTSTITKITKSPVSLGVVNAFEASGWTVFPWDWASDEPAFLAHLRQAGGG